eukprot:CAMPEP_0203833242 /NCGR_PEP_ID=MMETSP0115-20131106/72560_1 /ASSEMBLY_ACC=CAM_ASM_000227 /TAXON_ID=33651 /ORGANISM="Bicosoecid sp, Strain ms1" /LENGTH=302 /DNA_ID=CAMNT_0050742313 /DNA_START=202 /DNA_END=1114 /DNA_ORIENTATION=+
MPVGAPSRGAAELNVAAGRVHLPILDAAGDRRVGVARALLAAPGVALAAEHAVVGEHAGTSKAMGVPPNVVLTCTAAALRLGRRTPNGRAETERPRLPLAPCVRRVATTVVTHVVVAVEHHDDLASVDAPVAVATSESAEPDCKSALHAELTAHEEATRATAIGGGRVALTQQVLKACVMAAASGLVGAARKTAHGVPPSPPLSVQQIPQPEVPLLTRLLVSVDFRRELGVGGAQLTHGTQVGLRQAVHVRTVKGAEHGCERVQESPDDRREPMLHLGLRGRARQPRLRAQSVLKPLPSAGL